MVPLVPHHMADTINRNWIVHVSTRGKREKQPSRMFKGTFIDMLMCVFVCASCKRNNRHAVMRTNVCVCRRV